MEVNFNKLSRSPDGYCYRCKQCMSEYAKRYRESERGKKVREAYENKYKSSGRRREKDLMRWRGITVEEYDKMFKKQKGVCGICKNPETKTNFNGTEYNLAVDHCHTTDEIRGLLCGNCNKALGSFCDDIKLLESAIKYLKKSKR